MAGQTTDWESIEREYRAGQLSVSEIGRMHGVSHTAINKRAKRDGWSRDLTARVRREVSTRLVSEEVSQANASEAIETAAARGVEVVRQHRQDIGAARRTCAALLAELQAAGEHQVELHGSIEKETADDKTAARRNTMLRAVSLGARASVLSNLASAMRNLVGLERAAFNLNADDKDGADINDPDVRGQIFAEFSDEEMGVMRRYVARCQQFQEAGRPSGPKRRTAH